MQVHRRMMTRGAWGVTGMRVANRFAAVVITGLLIVPNAQAEPVSVTSLEDPAQPGFFTLDFGPALGGLSSGNITSTDYQLDVDPEAGTAELVNYFQHVEPLILPGGFNTGPIIVEVVDGSSTGTYDERTGVFTTTELYAVFFEGDLSAFGFESPVVLPSTSTGTVELNGTDDGRVDLEWFGEFALPNPFDPDGPDLDFTYTCVVNTVFAARPNLLVRLSLTPDVRELNLPFGLEMSLVTKLNHAARNIDEDFSVAAIRNLSAFVNAVRAQMGRHIPTDEAETLINGARDVIVLLEGSIEPTTIIHGLNFNLKVRRGRY